MADPDSIARVRSAAARFAAEAPVDREPSQPLADDWQTAKYLEMHHLPLVRSGDLRHDYRVERDVEENRRDLDRFLLGLTDDDVANGPCPPFDRSMRERARQRAETE